MKLTVFRLNVNTRLMVNPISLNMGSAWRHGRKAETTRQKRE